MLNSVSLLSQAPLARGYRTLPSVLFMQVSGHILECVQYAFHLFSLLYMKGVGEAHLKT